MDEAEKNLFNLKDICIASASRRFKWYHLYLFHIDCLKLLFAYSLLLLLLTAALFTIIESKLLFRNHCKRKTFCIICVYVFFFVGLYPHTKKNQEWDEMSEPRELKICILLRLNSVDRVSSYYYIFRSFRFACSSLGFFLAPCASSFRWFSAE